MRLRRIVVVGAADEAGDGHHQGHDGGASSPGRPAGSSGHRHHGGIDRPSSGHHGAVDAISFTAGITFQDDRVVTVDVTALDAGGITYTSEEGAGTVPWRDVKAVMLATTDHMLESGGSLLAMSEV